MVAAPNETQPLYMLGIIQHSQNRNAEAAASLEKVVAAKEDPSVRYSLGILYAYYLEQPDKGLEQLQKALDNPNTPADLKKAVAEEVTKIKEHKNHTPYRRSNVHRTQRPGLLSKKGLRPFCLQKKGWNGNP